MDKRATRQITLYTILFLVMLIFSAITFFVGYKIGAEKTDEKYAHLLKDPVNYENYEYKQQDLVTFYLTTYTAFDAFKQDWFNVINKIETNQVSNPAKLFDELASTAKAQAAEASSLSMKGNGLLEAAQQNYIKSLNSFEAAAKALEKSTDKKTSSEALALIYNDDNYNKAIEQALIAQKDYFAVMHQWTTSIDPTISNEFDASISQPISQWSNLPLITKMNIVAVHIDDQKLFENILPQDVVSRIDEMIATEQYKQLNLENTKSIFDLLITTDAIRNGDYQKYKASRYDQEFLPKIPFFTSK